jgi:hypothetical protein
MKITPPNGCHLNFFEKELQLKPSKVTVRSFEKSLFLKKLKQKTSIKFFKSVES